MLSPEAPTAILRPVAEQPDDTVLLQPGGAPSATGSGTRDPLDAWYALVGRSGDAGPIPA